LDSLSWHLGAPSYHIFFHACSGGISPLPLTGPLPTSFHSCEKNPLSHSNSQCNSSHNDGHYLLDILLSLPPSLSRTFVKLHFLRLIVLHVPSDTLASPCHMPFHACSCSGPLVTTDIWLRSKLTPTPLLASHPCRPLDLSRLPCRSAACRRRPVWRQGHCGWYVDVYI
jgi:hypothetical protein